MALPTSNMSFFEAFVMNRMRKMYPEGDIEVRMLPWANVYEVKLVIPHSDLVNSRVDREQVARDLDRKLFPSKPTPRRHWSIRGRLSGK